MGNLISKKWTIFLVGEPCPKVGDFNKFGQKLDITPERDIVVIYDFSSDEREDKYSIVPTQFQNGMIILARWFGENSPTSNRQDKCLKYKLEDKFNDMGWFTCKKTAMELIKKFALVAQLILILGLSLLKKELSFDSGMYEGNPRPYSQWRSNNSFGTV